jgi:hypothetical protein
MLQMGPHQLIRIEVRTVGGQLKQSDFSFSAGDEPLDRGRAVYRVAIRSEGLAVTPELIG